jgi:hypothetical protein
VQNFGGGLARINEAGGELAIMPSGSTVIPHDRSKRMVDGAGGTRDLRVTVYMDPSTGKLGALVDQRAGVLVAQTAQAQQAALPVGIQGYQANPRRRG